VGASTPSLLVAAANSIGSSAVRTRIVGRIVVIVTGAMLPVLATAGPALAKLKPDDGEVPGPSLGLANTLLLFVVIPIGVSLVIAALAVLPSALARPRYRPGKPWGHDPTWIGEPTAPTSAPSSSAQGGASAEW
jgi:hypothetical protein